MIKTIRSIIGILVWILTVYGSVMITFTCFKTILFDSYNPTSNNKTFIYIMGIVICLWLIRRLIKPEYVTSDVNNKFGENCYQCEQEMNDCICYEEDYVDEDITYDDRNDAM